MAMVARICPVCGASFQVAENRLKHGRGVNCSKACQYVANKEKLATAEYMNFTCIGCGDEFERRKCWVDGRAGAGKFCTRECRDINWTGEVTPNWQGGNGVYKRGPHWFSIRRAILERDNHTCQHCGETEGLHVHHKVPFRMFESHEEANLANNLITLCPPCHRKEDASTKWMKIEGIATSFAPIEWAALRAANDNAKMRNVA